MTNKIKRIWELLIYKTAKLEILDLFILPEKDFLLLKYFFIQYISFLDFIFFKYLICFF